jgi:PKD repeat protein
VPNDGERISLIVHDPFQTVPGPYPGGQLPIVADFSVVRVSGLTFAFAASASGGVEPYTYEWDFADGTSRGSGQTVTHTFIAGEYPVTLYVTDSAGTLVTKTHYVQA